MLHVNDGARLDTSPTTFQIPLVYDKEVQVQDSRTVLLTCTCTRNAAFQELQLAMQYSYLCLLIH